MADSNGDTIDTATIASLLLFVFLIVKVYGVAGFSLTTATGLIAAQPVSVLLGSISLYAYAFMAFTAILLAWLFMLGVKNRNTICRRFAPLILSLLVLSILLSPWRYLVDAVIATGIALLFALPIYLLLTKKRHAAASKDVDSDSPEKEVIIVDHRPRYRVIVLAVILMELTAFVVATLGKPWLPAEVVTLSRPIVANPVYPNTSRTSEPVVFLISDENGQTTMLLDADRYLISVPDGDIKRRMICHLGDQFSGANPLLETILGQPYQPHDLACWRRTDQPIEQTKKVAPTWVRILQWNFDS